MLLVFVCHIYYSPHYSWLVYGAGALPLRVVELSRAELYPQ